MKSKLSSSSLGKVCVITDATVDHVQGHHLYIVDLDRPGAAGKNRKLVPTAKLNGNILTLSALCVVGSILYVFEAEGEDEGEDGSGGVQKQVYSYDFSSSTSCVNLKHDMLKKVCEMNDTKFCPCATASPDGKRIVVHSSAIKPFHDREKRCDFELFVVNGEKEGGGKCINLPELWPWDDDLWERDEDISIISSVFKGGSVVLVLLRTRIYSLNLDRQGCKWEVFTGLEGRVPWGTPFDIIGEDICLTSFKAYAGAGCFSYPELSQSEARGPQYPIHLHNAKSGDDEAAEYFCILHAGSKQEDYFYSTPHYSIHVYRCDVTELKEKISSSQLQEDTLPATTIHKSLSFSLDKDYTYLLRKCHFTSIPPSNKSTTLHQGRRHGDRVLCGGLCLIDQS